MKNPKAIINMKNGSRIVLELFPNKAPNTVKSFIYAALHGFYDGHAIERIVSGSGIDFSYSAFHAILMPVIIEFSRCIDIYSSAKFETYNYKN